MSGEYRDLLLEHVGVGREEMRTEILDALRFLAEWLKGPVIDPQPPLDPETWQAMRCRIDRRVPESEADMLTDHRACRCPHCRWIVRNAPIVATWRLSDERRPHRLYSHPFGSLGAALAAVHRPDGAPSRSRMGSLMARLREIQGLGTEVQTTARFDRDPLEIRRTDLTIDVERCVIAACSPAEVRGSVSTGAAIVLVTASAIDGYAPEAHASEVLSVPAVKGIVSRARKRLTIELAARDLIPAPRERAKLGEEIAKLRINLTRPRGASSPAPRPRSTAGA